MPRMENGNMVTKGSFGYLNDGREVTAYRISNSFDESVTVLDFGATVHSIVVRDRDGELADITLGAFDAPGLLNRAKEGSTIGRFANRIGRAEMVLDGRKIKLEEGRSGCMLHSGSANYGKRFFEVAAISDDCIECHLDDEGGAGFDCRVDVKVRFTFGDDHCLKINYDLVPDGTTVLAPTNHAYFDLSGARGVEGHILQINAGRIAVKDEYGVPWGDTLDVKDTEYDFLEPRTIGKQYDDYYILDDVKDGPNAILRDPESGRLMEVFTDMPCIILYTPINDKPAEIPGKYGIHYNGAHAVCLEAQYVPNSMNFEGFPSPVFRAGEHFISQTVYRFGTYTV